jgi:flavin reductase (DIM6/NTAB) family NADH-FMN oxidoreductase RutF
MKTIDLASIPLVQRQQYLQYAIAPRPICFASTIDKDENVNLSPFSFFNMFSTNPPVVVFSPSSRVRDNTQKHTLENVLEVPEVVINIVDYDMVQQVSLSSVEYPKGINEFVKAGFTEQPSNLVKPPMVKESKVKMECRVLEVKRLGEQAGAGNLVICEVLMMHIDESILDETGMIDQRKFKLVARLGGDYYCSVGEENLFIVPKPNRKMGIGVDRLPEHIRNSSVLTGNDLGMLGNVEEIPLIDPSYENEDLKKIVQYYSLNPDDMEREIHLLAQKLLKERKVAEAWQVLLG